MITDEILNAVTMINEHFLSTKEKQAGEKILAMLTDFNEDTWEEMNEDEKEKWILEYTEEN